MKYGATRTTPFYQKLHALLKLCVNTSSFTSVFFSLLCIIHPFFTFQGRCRPLTPPLAEFLSRKPPVIFKPQSAKNKLENSCRTVPPWRKTNSCHSTGTVLPRGRTWRTMRSRSSMSSWGMSAFMNAFTVVETSSAFFVSGKAVCTTYGGESGKGSVKNDKKQTKTAQGTVE